MHFKLISFAACLVGTSLADSTQLQDWMNANELVEGENRSEDTCWKESHQRSTGTVPDACPDGMSMQAGLCYEDCKSGYSGFLNQCLQDCPSKMKDDGLYCRKRSLFDSCPRNMSNIGISCKKDTYRREVGTAPICGDGLYKQAGLCYEQCELGFDGVGTTCFGQCPDNTEECGALCLGLDGESCAEYTVRMTLAGVQMANGNAVAGVEFVGGLIYPSCDEINDDI